MKAHPLVSLACALALLALPASADLVGLYTFDRANPFEAVIGSPAKEGVMSGNNSQPVLSDTMFTITLVADAAVLGARTGVVAVPSKSALAVPNPGLAKDWTIVLPFYCPANATWRCFFKFDNGANSDGSLFIKNNADIGAGSYTTGLPGIVGAWHQLTVSSANGTQTIWYDTTKLGQTRSWNIAGLSLLLFSFDNDGEDALTYLDDIRLYDETAPAEVFPNGTSGVPTIFAPYDESSYEDDFAAFSRAPDRIIEDPPYRTYVFERHGTFTFLPVKRRDACSALFVGGGGAGGLQRGGGGGGGGVVSVSDLSFLPQFYTATVGAGGIPAVHTYWYQNSADANKLHEGVTPATASGGATTLSAAGVVLHEAHGGGGGGNFNYAGSNKPGESYGLDGASGGGSSGQSTVRAAGIVGEGHAGGAATTSGDNSAGGGGGAGSAGADGTQNDPGDGGNGVENSITGTPVVYGGGGGAGGGYSGNGVGAGGTGGGGTGVSAAAARTRTTAANGTDGLGGGGGGGSGQNNNPFNSMGGRGGDGAMILRILMTSDDDPEPALAVNVADVGFTNAAFNVHLLSLGSGADSASVTLRVSANADMSYPFFTTNLAAAATTVPAVFTPACAPLAVGTAYYVQATAMNNLGIEGASAIIPFETPVPGPVFTATVTSDHVAPAVSLAFTGMGWGEAVTSITVQVSTTGDFTDPDVTKTIPVNLDTMPATVDGIVLAGLPAASPLHFRFIAENSNEYETFVDLSVPIGLTSGDNVWSGLSEDIDDPAAYVFEGGLPAAGKKLFFTSPAGLSPIIDRDTAMPSLRFTSGSTDDGADSSYLGGYHSCGYDFSGSGVLTFTAEKPIWHGTKGTNVIENPILFDRANNQTVYVTGRSGRLDLTGKLMLPNGVSNTTMYVSGDGGEVHFGGPSPDFMGKLTIESSFTLFLDHPFAMTNVSRIFFGGGWGAATYLKNNTGAPMTFPRCERVDNELGWSSTRTRYAGAPFIFPVGTLYWAPRSSGDSYIDADLFVKNLQVTKHNSNGDAVLDKSGIGTLSVMETMSWDANECKHYVHLRNGCFWPQTAAGLPPSGEFFAPEGANNNMATLGLNGDYAPMLDGSSTPRVFQGHEQTRWGFTGFGGDRTVCWNADPTFNLTNTANDHVALKLTDATTVNSVSNTYNNYYAYPARLMFGNRSEFADGTVLFLNPIRYELGQNWDTTTYFESTNHVVAARMRGSLKLGNRDKTWNFSGRNFGGYLALEAENTDFTGKVNVYEKGNLLVNSNLVARSATVQSGAGLGGTGELSTGDGTTVKSGGALFGGEWNKGGTLTLGGKVTFENGSALRVEVGESNENVGCVKLASGSVLKLGSPVYVDVDTDPRFSPVRGFSIKVLDWSEASFDSGARPTNAAFTMRPEINSDLKSMRISARYDGLYVSYVTVRCPAGTVLFFK